MTVHQAFEFPATRLTTRPESLFMLAYRCWQAGYDYADADCWQYAWGVLANELGPQTARPVLNAVEDFVRTLRQAFDGRIDYFPPPCCRTSAGERRVIALIAALQANDQEAVRRRHDDLCGAMQPATADFTLAQARALATALEAANLLLDPNQAARAPGSPSSRLH